MIALQFGAGNIGRGFLGQLYSESGYEIIFVDVADDLIRTLNKRGEYPLRIVDEHPYDVTIGNVRALHAEKQRAEVEGAIAQAAIISTAVGVPILGKLASVIASGLSERFKNPLAPPTNIIVCENMIGAGPFLKDLIKQSMSIELHSRLDSDVGFVEASIGRMVPAMTPEQRAEDPLLVCVEAYCELPVDKDAIRGPIPPIKHLQPRSNFGAYVERKLFIHNAGHAITAYLGHLRGYEFIWQAIADPEIAREVEGALAEARAALVAKHGLDAVELKASSDDIVRRFHNKALGDQVDRVARDPLRKLGPNDRLIGAAQLCLDHGITPIHLAFAVAATIQYDHPDDPSARLLRELRAERGVSGVLTKVCELQQDSPLFALVNSQSDRLQTENWIKK
jgi:mannitol-1-phosphate 5-dehydrogenase